MDEQGRKRKKETGFHKSLMVMNTFKVHSTDDVSAAMLSGHTGVVKVPVGRSSKLQPLRTLIN